MKTKKVKRVERDHYLELIRELPLKPIRTKADFARAMRMVSRLAAFEEGTLESGEQDYLETLTLLLEAYDRSHPVKWPKISGLEMLKFLMEQSGMTVNALGDVVGSQPLASMILSGKREISKEVMRRLGSHFQVDACVFL